VLTLLTMRAAVGKNVSRKQISFTFYIIPVLEIVVILPILKEFQNLKDIKNKRHNQQDTEDKAHACTRFRSCGRR
jgi:hypothetical protein